MSGGAGHADGRPHAPVLGARRAVERAARSARARRCASACWARTSSRSATASERGRADPEPLPAPRRQPVLRPQRGRGAALRLPRLEVRRDRPLRRHAQRAGRRATSSTRSAPPPTRAWSAGGSSGPTWARAPRRRRCRTSRPTWCRRAASRSTSASATGCRRWRATSTPATRCSCTWAACRPTTRPPGTWARYALSRRAPKYEVVDTDSGVMYGACRPAEPDTNYWRIANFLFPFWAMVPTGVLGLEVRARAWVPDGRRATRWRSRSAGWRAAPPRSERRTAGRGPVETLPNTTDWYGRFRAVANANNDYLIDRDQQKTASYTGIGSIFLQDQAVTESMGADLRPHAGAAGHQRPDGHPHAQAAHRRRPGAARWRADPARRGRAGGLRRALGRRRAPARRRTGSRPRPSCAGAGPSTRSSRAPCWGACRRSEPAAATGRDSVAPRLRRWLQGPADAGARRRGSRRGDGSSGRGASMSSRRASGWRARRRRSAHARNRFSIPATAEKTTTICGA